MKNNQVVIERDMFCPYCGGSSAVLIAETVSSKKRIGCAAVGLKDGCLIAMTGGCWTIISGIPLYDIKEECITNLYGFCPCCGNTYPVNKPEVRKETVSDRFNAMKQKTSQVFDKAKSMVSRGGQQKADYTDQLRELKALLDSGQITEDEYNRRKDEVLSQIR
ncbi:MAG: SHOCT domain-containing protein [Oscillospiraceae bacterium]|nr:SHOCT domain-containing protein [Oscillospiraceae bacterium]